jgi:hypothetical protein
MSRSSLGSSRLDSSFKSGDRSRSRKTKTTHSQKSSGKRSKNSLLRNGKSNQNASFNPLDSVGSPNIFSAKHSRLSQSRSRSRMSGKSNSTSALAKRKVSKTAKREHCKECVQCHLWKEKIKGY